MSYISVPCDNIRGINKNREIIELDRRLTRVIKNYIDIMHKENKRFVDDELYFSANIKFNGNEIIYTAVDSSEYEKISRNIFKLIEFHCTEVLINIVHIGAGNVISSFGDNETLPIYELSIIHTGISAEQSTFYYTPSKNFIIFIGSKKIDVSDLIDVPIETV